MTRGSPTMDNEEMEIQDTGQLVAKRCQPCEGGVPAFTLDEANRQLVELPGWSLAEQPLAPTGDVAPLRIRRTWTVKNFVAGMEFFQKVADVAEAEGHHPDLHLEGYRHVRVEIWTHAIGGLSENDFILAAKIDQLPIRLAK